jgi:hypothetical protein
MKAAVLAISFGVAIAPVSQAQNVEYIDSSNYLLEQCQAAVSFMDGERNADPSSVSGCFSYLGAFRDAIRVFDGRLICIPYGVTNGQLARVFVLWADKNPALLHENQGIGVVRALGVAFPCPSSPAP